MMQQELDEILAQHELWLAGLGGKRADLRGADLRHLDMQWADMQWADMQGANMQGADTRGANFDRSCFSLSCGGSHFRCDAKLVRQLLAHISTLEVVDADDDLKSVLVAILPEAKKSHRARDLGLL
jgi:hypothetical protein